MSVYKLLAMSDMPAPIRRAFLGLSPVCPEQKLLQEVAARATLDGLGYTGIHRPSQHDHAVREARIWFKFDRYMIDLFDLADIDGWAVRRAVVAHKILYISNQYPKEKK